MHQGHEAPWCTKTNYRHHRLRRRSGRTHRQHETEVDTEAGMLSGVSRKRSIRSSPCWFTEFCKSQCLSHFAAPFIVVRAETSVAESCKEAFTVWRLPPTGKRSTTHKRSTPEGKNSRQQERSGAQLAPKAPPPPARPKVAPEGASNSKATRE